MNELVFIVGSLHHFFPLPGNMELFTSYIAAISHTQPDPINIQS